MHSSSIAFSKAVSSDPVFVATRHLQHVPCISDIFSLHDRIVETQTVIESIELIVCSDDSSLLQLQDFLDAIVASPLQEIVIQCSTAEQPCKMSSTKTLQVEADSLSFDENSQLVAAVVTFLLGLCIGALLVWLVPGFCCRRAKAPPRTTTCGTSSPSAAAAPPSARKTLELQKRPDDGSKNEPINVPVAGDTPIDSQQQQQQQQQRPTSSSAVAKPLFLSQGFYQPTRWTTIG
jgi:hypothetical protein